MLGLYSSFIADVMANNGSRRVIGFIELIEFFRRIKCGVD
jgi:hypothetical protein